MVITTGHKEVDHVSESDCVRRISNWKLNFVLWSFVSESNLIYSGLSTFLVTHPPIFWTQELDLNKTLELVQSIG